MPTAATTASASHSRQQTNNNNAPQAGLVPFVRASAQHYEPAGIDVTKAMTSSDQDLGVFSIPAYGYVRGLVLLVQATGGTGTSVTAAEDSPWGSIKSIGLTEPNGAVIHTYDTGYGLFLSNKFGGYRDPAGADPRSNPVYSGVGASTGNFSYMLRIPVELNERDGLGSLPNQSAAAEFKLRLTLAASTSVYGTVPSTLPSVRIRVYLEAWEQPEGATAGQSNQLFPPAVNTTQFWSYQTYNVSAGQQTIPLIRKGNWIRNLIFVQRRGGTSRANGQSDWPDPLTLSLDTAPLEILGFNQWQMQMWERSGFGGALSTTIPANDSAGGQENGVFVLDFMHDFDGTYGLENRNLWLPTLASTRLEISGTFANAGVLTVYTNDVAIEGNVFL